MISLAFPAVRILGMSRAEFDARFGTPSLGGALCGYTREADTRTVLTLLVQARPRRVLEVGTASGHMTANLTRWTADDAEVFTIDLVQGMAKATAGATAQQVEIPGRADWGRFADHFGMAHKVFFITADTMRYDFGRLAPLEFVFIDGGHDFEHVQNDSRKSYDALAPGGWLVWHDFHSPVPWVKVREAIEVMGFAEPVLHVEGTEVAFLRKHGAPGPCHVAGAEAYSPVPQGQCPGPGTPVVSVPAGDLLHSHAGENNAGIARRVRVAWEGDVEGLHSLAIVNRAICIALINRGHDLGLVSSSNGQRAITPERLPLDPRLAARLVRGPEGRPAQVHVRHQWPPNFEPPANGRWVLMQPWEYGSLPKSWLPMLRRVDEIWAYSRSVRDCYLEAGVPADRVHVVPLGVDPEVFRPGLEPLPLPPGPSFRFLFVGGTIFRKGIDVLLTAFARAFQPLDGIGLVIKDMGSASFYRGQTAEAQVAALRERGYPVEYIDRSLNEPELAGLYAACDALVHPFRGEGFSLPVVEAMACGLPVIITGAGPALDYASDETAFLIPAHRGNFSECRVGDMETIGRPWLNEPDEDALVELLRRVASEPTAARAKGSAASKHIRENFTWERSAEAAERRLMALVDKEFHARGEGNSEFHAKTQREDAKTQRNTSDFVAREDHATQFFAPFASSSRLCVKSPVPVRTARISLTMIVKNESGNLEACLGSVAALFDEIVVVDTGSADRTKEIAREFGARVFDFVWVDDFAAARNAALARATGDYAFWLDADDVVDPDQREKFQALFDGLRRGDEAAHVIRCSCDPGPNGDGGQTVVDHIRLFPLREDVRWTYRVHEQILPALRRVNVPVRWTDITVRHTGYTDPALRERKLQRDCKILLEELAERPDDPFVRFNLGSIAIERKDWTGALDHLRHSLTYSAPTDSITRKLFALIARAHQMMGNLQGALAVCAEGLSFDPDDAELLFRKAVVHRTAGQPAEAEESWRRILTLRRPDQFCSVNQGIYGHLTLRNLAVLAEERGDRTTAMECWTRVLAECPSDTEAGAVLERLRA